MKTGILYALFNDEENPEENQFYQHHLLMSVTSVRKFNDLPITIITNRHDLELDFDNVQIKKVNFEEYFPKRYIEGSSRLTRWCNFTIRKLEVFKHYLPYEITIYSDVDILFLDDPKKIIHEDGFFKVNEAATGMMLTKREVFTKMMKKFPERKYESDQIVNGKNYKSDNCYDLFAVGPYQTLDQKRYLSEDYYFSRLWTEHCGGEIWADVASPLIHFGNRGFKGNVGYTFTRVDA